MKKLTSLLRWIDNNLIKILIFGFILLIPLYPKFPIRIIDYTYIAVRAEDIYIAVLVLLYFVQLFRKKVLMPPRQFLIPIVLFWAAAGLSFLWNGYISGTVIYKHLGLLHTLRRVEYMIIFFIAASTVRSKRDFMQYLYTILLTMGVVSLYGMGQKYFGLPAIQTMNPEFAKGHLLYLTPEARVSATFAGHYDLAAYLVLLLPVTLGAFFSKKYKIFFIFFVIGLFTLMLTASRISYLAYLASTFPFLLFIKKYRYFVAILILSAGFTFLSSNLTSRFLQTVQIKQIFVNEKTGQVVVPQKISSKELPAGTYYIPIKDDPKQTQASKDKNEELLQQKLIEDIQWEASRAGKILTSTEAAVIAASQSAGLKEVNTVISDISLATRLQVEWPRAFNAFLKNPILGTGPSSITESTDNDYLRWIGEFGALGTGLFVYIFFVIAQFVWKKSAKLEKEEKLLYYGFLFGMAGLIMNASYIDVFEASKVAYTYWMVAGIFVASLMVEKSQKTK